MSNSFTWFGFPGDPNFNAFSRLNKIPFGSDHDADVMMRLDSPCSYGPKDSKLMGTKRKWCDINGADTYPEHTSLALGLGHTSSSSDFSKGSLGTACTVTSLRETTDEESSIDLGFNFQLHLGTDNAFNHNKTSTGNPRGTESNHTFDLQLSLSTGLLESTATSVTPSPIQQQNSIKTTLTINPTKKTDEECSTSSDWKLNSHVLPSYDISENSNINYTNQKIFCFNPVAAVPNLPDTKENEVKYPLTCTSGMTHPQQRISSTKNCQFQGCTKVARGASGLCISHGGGRRCQKVGCHKGAEGKTVYCKAHGGGHRCQHLGCTKSAEGRTDYCIAHGGGLRCSHEGCNRAARGKSGLCIRHGGGKRCQNENCTKSAEGHSGLCISHGGGRRCQFPSCTKGAQGSTMFCKAHGGGKRCTAPGCTKGAEGSTPFCKAHGGGKRCSFEGGGVCPKSVHGGTLYCVAHGGGKRCVVSDCTKSARGRTLFCVKHGGGKRCKSEHCGKSAQGGTDFCKAHGGGKRCSWGQPGSEFGACGPSCDKFARGKIGLCAAHGALVQDCCSRRGSTLGLSSVLQQPILVKSEGMKASPSEVIINPALMPSNCKSIVSFSSEDTEKLIHFPGNSLQSTFTSLPEGRVHGGSLMALLSSHQDARTPTISEVVASIEQSMSEAMMHEWL